MKNVVKVGTPSFTMVLTSGLVLKAGEQSKGFTKRATTCLSAADTLNPNRLAMPFYARDVRRIPCLGRNESTMIVSQHMHKLLLARHETKIVIFEEPVKFITFCVS